MTEQDYKKEIEFIFNQFPSYQKVGKVAYKPGIETMQTLDKILGEPHKNFKTIHIAGTNGKGSTSHMIAAGLMAINSPILGNNTQKLRVGLYTSPHLVDFRERIKVNGEMVSKEFVYNFIKKYKTLFLELKASFFEITTAMAFAYFKQESVNVAVIECGLGGRLDSTNIISPILSIITNIGLDHCEHLGYSLESIAYEKCGIIKNNIPIIIGEKGFSDKCVQTFKEQAKIKNAPIYFAEDINNNPDNILYNKLLELKLDLQGEYQKKNIKTVCTAFNLLFFNNEFNLQKDLNTNKISYCELANNISKAAHLTGLRGRWEIINTKPLTICDTGHNAHGFSVLGKQILETYKKLLSKNKHSKLFIVFGVVADKDLISILEFLPKDAYYFFVNSSGTRALQSTLLRDKMISYGFKGEAVVTEKLMDSSVIRGFEMAQNLSGEDDFIFIGGSTFVVSEIFFSEL